MVVKDNGYKDKVGTLHVYIIDSWKTFKHRKLDENQYDIAVLDWKLLKGTAEPILKAIRHRCHHVTIISGYADEPKFRKLWVKLGVPESHIKDKTIGLHMIESIFKEAINAIQT